MKDLKFLTVGDDEVSVVYKLSHNDVDSQTTLELNLDLRKNAEGWKASIDFDQILPRQNPTDSAFALANWLERMAEELKKHNYDEIDLKNL